FAKRSKTERKQWGSMIDQYLRDRAALAGVVVLVDVRRGPESLEASLIQYLQEIREPAIPYLFVATKVDKLPAAQLKPRLDALRKTTPGRIIGFSAKTGLGREELWKQLLEAIPASNRQKACL
ncbi:MAG TPA: ribosome biogenesis GTP-binding protein YsxC, partial [Polyangiaceae bacterium]|nr:ribosome biogenesis GTP-binding protein YsxC [Polyangiaceae bacterium]